jgi:hypothetical protein
MRITLLFLLLTNTVLSQRQNTANVLGNMGYADASLFQLADPVVTASAIFFEQENEISLSLPFDKVTLRYTLDGSEPNEQSAIYTKPVRVKNSGQFKAKAFHPTCRPSNTVHVEYLKINKKAPIKNIRLANSPHENYPGIGAVGLIDLFKGSNDFRDGKWMGFNDKEIEIWIEMEKDFYFEKITASMLSAPASWIFPPAAIEIFISKNGNEFYEIAKKEFDPPMENALSGHFFYDLFLKKEKGRFLKILIKNIPSIPDWHPGKGASGWLFLDEIIIE